MSKFTKTITVYASLTTHGDALLYGMSGTGDFLSGVSLKQSLFAWHSPSFYGTELEVQQVEGLELVLLPAEQVIPFFAENTVLEHVEWIWEEQAGLLVKLAPLLAAEIKVHRYVPSFSAFRSG